MNSGDPAPSTVDVREEQKLPPVIQYWHASEVPAYLHRVFASIERHNPGSERLIFSEATATEFIEEHFSEREVAAFRSCAVPAMQSDYFRYCALFALGGVYSDLDFLCIGSFRPLFDDAEVQLFRRPLGMVMNGFFAFRSARHPFLRLTLDVVTTNIERRELDDITGVTGPLVLTGLTMMYELGSVDAFMQVAKNKNRQWEPRVMTEVIDDFDTVIEAFDGVRLNPIERLTSCISNRDIEHVHEKHWTKWEGSIYR
jgi:mannosyltransferase OCH1-like enzyme